MKTEQEVSQAAIDWVNDTDVTLDPEMTAIYAFIAGAQFAAPKWISVEESVPEIGQTVAFIVSSTDRYYNGHVIGGKYQGCKFGFHEFSVPGIGFCGSHWYPILSAPTNDQKSEL